MEQKMNNRNVYGANGGNKEDRTIIGKIGSGLAGIGLPIVAMMNLFGILDIPFNILFVTVTGFPQVMAGFVVGLLFVALSVICGSWLKKYITIAKRMI